MMSPSEIKKAQTSWRRRRGAMQRHDWHYQLLLERHRAADARVSAADRQGGFYHFWNRPDELANTEAEFHAAWEARHEASRDVRD